MALTKQQIIDLLAEERQILVLLEKAKAQRDATKQAAEQVYIAALNQADVDVVATTQKAESRLVEIAQQLTQDGAWEDPKP